MFRIIRQVIHPLLSHFKRVYCVLLTDAVVVVSMIILIGLFSIQRFGTSKVGFLFAPALSLWFFSLASIGIYNLIRHDITVLRALDPAYIYFFFRKNGIQAWSALGGCVLCITGMFFFNCNLVLSMFSIHQIILSRIQKAKKFCLYLNS